MGNYIEFIEKEHIYLVDGVIVPSVTQLLKKLFPCKYKNIPKKILEDKSIYGVELHKFIEIIEKKKPKRPLAYIKKYYNPNIYQIESLKDYLEIKKKYNIEITDSEKMVVYKDIYCGTLDLKGTVNDKKAIIDIKTTYDLDELYVSWQNSLYEMASEPVDELYCMWLPKGHLGKLVKLERINGKDLKILIGEEYE